MNACGGHTKGVVIGNGVLTKTLNNGVWLDFKTKWRVFGNVVCCIYQLVTSYMFQSTVFGTESHSGKAEEQMGELRCLLQGDLQQRGGLRESVRRVQIQEGSMVCCRSEAFQNGDLGSFRKMFQTGRGLGLWIT